jgi:hypothetical protein
MTLVLDAGALVALERNDRAMWRRMKAAIGSGDEPRTHGGVVAQVWRGGQGRQVPLARALGAVEVVALDERLGRQAGVLLGRARQSDAVDAAVVVLADADDLILTSDPLDLQALVEAWGRPIDVVPV